MRARRGPGSPGTARRARAARASGRARGTRARAASGRRRAAARPARRAGRASLPAPSSISASPAVACGTNTCSSPSPPPAAAPANCAHSPVMSRTVSRRPVVHPHDQALHTERLWPLASSPPRKCPAPAPAAATSSGGLAALRRASRWPFGWRPSALRPRRRRPARGTQPGVPVVEAHQVGRAARRAVHLDDLAASCPGGRRRSRERAAGHRLLPACQHLLLPVSPACGRAHTPGAASERAHAHRVPSLAPGTTGHQGRMACGRCNTGAGTGYLQVGRMRIRGAGTRIGLDNPEQRGR